MGKSNELVQLLKTGNSDAARKLISKLKKTGKKKVLAKELNLPDETGHGQTVMHYCAAQNFVEFLVDLADMGASIDVLDDRGFTPLHLGATYGRASSVTALLRKGADPNISAHAGDTPLHFACQNGHTATVEALVAQHSNCTMLNVSGHTPLDVACQNGHPQVVAILLKSGQYSQTYLQRSGMPHSALLLAAKSGHNDIIALLINHGFDINRKLQGYSGNCLHEAILYGKVETVRYLLQCGADIRITNNQGLGPLEIVQMYTDPRSAGQMKQVLQDSMAQEARVRIAQQHQQQQQFAPQQHQGSPGMRPGQQQAQQQQYYQQAQQAHPQQPQQPHPLTQQAHHQPAAPQQYQRQQQYQLPQGDHQSGQASPSRVEKKLPAGAQPAFSYLGGGLGGQSPLKKRSESTGSQPQSYQQQQQQGYQHQQQPQQEPVYQQPHQPPAPTRGLSMQEQIQQQAAYHQSRAQSQSIDQTVSHAQQESKRLSNPADLASMIAAKAASRRPMTTSPTRKDFPHDETERFTRSSTMSSDTSNSSLENARHSALRRRNSLTEQKSIPELPYDHNPPTLPRRSNMGPPSFKPPPPSEAPPGSYHGDTPGPDHSSMPRMRRVTPKAPPPEPSMDNELLKKLQRRQNRIEHADDVVEGEVPQPEPETLPPAPPPPERTTLAMSAPPPPTQPPPPSSTAPPTFHQPPPPTTNPPKAGPPPPAPKAKPKPKPKQEVVMDLPPGVPPWQVEILRKKREAEIQQQLEDERKAEEESVRREGEERARAEAERIRLEEERIAEETQRREEEEQRLAEERRKADEEKQRKAEARRLAAEKRRKTEEERLRQEEEMRKVVERRLKMNEKKQRELETGVVEETEEEQRRKEEEERLKKEARLAEERAREEEERLRRVKEGEERVRLEGVKEEERVRLERVKEEEERVRREEEGRLRHQRELELARLEAERLRAEERERAAVIAPPEEFSGQQSEQRLPPPPSFPSPPSQLQPEELRLLQQVAIACTPPSEMSRSGSLSSINTAGTGSPGRVTDPVPIADWLASYKLVDYIPLFEQAGYDATDFLQGLMSDELLEIGVSKPGHKKKILAAFASLRHKEHLLMTKPPSVPVWLDLIGLSQYDQALIDAGYDDIDFISDITSEELEDIGITRRGHLKRFMRGIAELVEVTKSSPSTPSTILPATPSSILPVPPSQQFNGVGGDSNLPDDLPPEEDISKTPEPIADIPPTPSQEPPTSFKANSSEVMKSSNFSKMKSLLAMNMGIGTESIEDKGSSSPSPVAQRRVVKAPPLPKRGRNSLSSLSSNQDVRGSVEVPVSTQQQLANQIPQAKMASQSPFRRSVNRELDGEEQGTLTAAKKSYSVEDITAALDDMVEGNELLRNNARAEYSKAAPPPGATAAPPPSRPGISADEELDALTQALKGFPPKQKWGPDEEKDEEPDELLAHIDDMLADLNTELDFMIPGTDV